MFEPNNLSSPLQFIRLILLDILDQYHHLVSLRDSSRFNADLTFKDFTPAKHSVHIAKKGSEAHLTYITRNGESLPLLHQLTEVRGRKKGIPSIKEVFNALGKRRVARDGFEVGSPYIFGRMVSVYRHSLRELSTGTGIDSSVRRF
jgi:hypothetical protein